MRPLSIPVILGTTRKGRMSAPAAQFVYGQLQKRDGITTDLIDIARLNLPVDDAGEAIKDPRFSESMERSDAVVIVTPEYNHSFPGLLKRFRMRGSISMKCSRRTIGLWFVGRCMRLIPVCLRAFHRHKRK